MEKIAVFPGSFDPFTKGHEDIVLRALPLFDKIIIAVGNNTTKASYFNLNKRISIIEQTFENNIKISIKEYDELTIDFCKKNKAQYILRGIRNTIDFEYENSIAQMNKSLWPTIETVLFFSSPDHAHISSTIVREILKYNGDVKVFLPDNVKL